MKIKQVFLASILCLGALAAACGINSVTKQELENVKAGDVLVYRFQRSGKSWFYADKVTRIEGDKIFYNPSKSESTSGSDARLKDFQTSESSMTKAELLKFDTEQGDEQKKIIWIQ